MAREYGEGFTRPRDYLTGEPIPGSPRMGSPETTRQNGNGMIILSENLGPGEEDPEKLGPGRNRLNFTP